MSVKGLARNLLVLFILLISGCVPSLEVSPTPTSTPSPTKTPFPTATSSPVPSPTPEPRELTICTGSEPDTLFIYGASMYIARLIQQAIFDGPIDRPGYEYQAVILEKLPSLADGDAVIQAVTVQEGDFVIDDRGELIVLSPGDVVRPAGCLSSDCAITYEGGPLALNQMSVTFTIKEGVKWSDGEPLTAFDSVFSYEFARRCEDEWGRCGHGGLVDGSLETVDRTFSYTALDAHTVQWVGTIGFLDPHYYLNFFTPLPRHQLS
ncbi:MAG: ABC transporter substrate-binding protein, partial [Chloroflexota bacterium]